MILNTPEDRPYGSKIVAGQVYSVVKSGLETVGLTKLGEQKAGTHGDPRAITADICGSDKIGVLVMPTGQVVSTGTQGSE